MDEREVPRSTSPFQEKHLTGILSITLVEASNLRPMNKDGSSDPYCKFKLGHQKHKSKVGYHGNLVLEERILDISGKWFISLEVSAEMMICYLLFNFTLKVFIVKKLSISGSFVMAKLFIIITSLTVYLQVLRRTLDPVWKERFEIRVYSDSSSILEISVYDYEEFGFSDNFIGRLVTSLVTSLVT